MSPGAVHLPFSTQPAQPRQRGRTAVSDKVRTTASGTEKIFGENEEERTLDVQAGVWPWGVRYGLPEELAEVT